MCRRFEILLSTDAVREWSVLPQLAQAPSNVRTGTDAGVNQRE